MAKSGAQSCGQAPWDDRLTLHDNNQLNSRDVHELATRITHAITHLDQRGRLPDPWLAATPLQQPLRPVPERG